MGLWHNVLPLLAPAEMVREMDRQIYNGRGTCCSYTKGCSVETATIQTADPTPVR